MLVVLRTTWRWPSVIISSHQKTANREQTRPSIMLQYGHEKNQTGFFERFDTLPGLSSTAL